MHNNLRGFTLLEVTISAAIFAVAVGGFIGIARLTAKSMGNEMALSEQMRQSEQQIDALLISMRWISVTDPSLQFQFPKEQSKDMPKITFCRIKSTDADGNYTYGDRITYYWLPSSRENAKYATGNAALYDSADIDGIDHDNNGVANDGVIWRKLEVTDGSANLEKLGYESFASTTDLRVVFENVPPPFYKVLDVVVPLDSFRVEVGKQAHNVTVTLKRFVRMEDTTLPDRTPRPDVVGTGGVIFDNKVTVLTTRRTFCTRN